MSTVEEIRKSIDEYRKKYMGEHLLQRLLSGVTFGVTDVLGTQRERPEGALSWLLSQGAEMGGFLAGPMKVLAPLKLARTGGAIKKAAQAGAEWGLHGAIYATPKSLVTGELADIPSTGAAWGGMGGLGRLIASPFLKGGVKPPVGLPKEPLPQPVSPKIPVVKPEVKEIAPKKPWQMIVKEIEKKDELPAIFIKKTNKTYIGESHGNILSGLSESGIIKDAEIKAGEVISGWKYRGIKGFLDGKYLLYKLGERPIGVHEGFIKQAIAKGEPVPATVLKDYPHLIKPISRPEPIPKDVNLRLSDDMVKGEVDNKVASIIVKVAGMKNVTPKTWREFILRGAKELGLDEREIRTALFKTMKTVPKNIQEALIKSGISLKEVTGFRAEIKGKSIIGLIQDTTRRAQVSPVGIGIEEITHIQTMRHGSKYMEAYLKNVKVLENSVKDTPPALIELNLARTQGFFNQMTREARVSDMPRPVIEQLTSYTFKSSIGKAKPTTQTMTGEEMMNFFAGNKEILLSYLPVGNLLQGSSLSVSASVVRGITSKEVFNEEFGPKAYFTSAAKGIGRFIWDPLKKYLQLPYWKKSMQQIYKVIDGGEKFANKAYADGSITFTHPVAEALLKTTKNPELKQAVARSVVLQDMMEKPLSKVDLLSFSKEQMAIWDSFKTMRNLISKESIAEARIAQSMDSQWAAYNNAMKQLEGMKKAQKAPKDFAAVRELENKTISTGRDLKEMEQAIINKNTIPEWYMPHARKGNTVIVALDKNGEVLGTDIIQTNFLTYALNVKSTKKRLQKLFGEELGALKDYKQSEVPHDLMMKLPWDIVDVILKSRQARIISELPQVEQLEMRELFLKHLHGWKGIRRKGTPGFKTDFNSVFTSFEDMYSRAVNRHYRLVAFKEATSLARNIQKIEDKEYAKAWIEGVYGMGESTWTGGVRYGLGIWFLGLKPSFAIQNMTQTFLNIPAEIARYVGLTKSVGIFSRSYKDATVFMLKKDMPKSFSPELQGLLKEAQKRGDLSAQWMQQWIGVERRGLIQKKWKTTTEAVLTMLQKWTEKFNRSQAFISGYYVGKQRGLKGDKLYDFSKSFIYNTQYPFEKHALPLILQGRGPVTEFAKMAYMFKNFTWNTFHRLIKVYTKGDYKLEAKIAQTISIGMIGGMFGIPGSMMFKRLMAEKGIDIDEKMRNFVNNSKLGQTLNDAFSDSMLALGVHPDTITDIKNRGENAILKGLPAIFNVETANWVGTGDIPIQSFDDILGIVDSIPASVRRGWKHLWQKKYWKATEDIAPSTVRNIMRSYRWAQEGVRTDDGELLFVPTAAERIMKGLGVPVLKERRIKEIKWITGKMVRGQRMRTALYNEKLARAILDKDEEKMKEIREEIADYNSTAPVHLRIKLSLPSLRYRLQEMRQGAGVGGVPKQMRQEVLRRRQQR